MEEKKSLKERCKEGWNRHKRKIKIAAAVGTSLLLGCVVVQNWEDITEMFNNLPDVQSLPELPNTATEAVTENICEPMLDVIVPMREITVKAHTMKLPKGRHASETAKAFAEECGVLLGERETMRHGCVKQIAA